MIAEVQACLRAWSVLTGLLRGGYVSYEAAPAMDPALQVRPDTYAARLVRHLSIACDP